MIVAPVLFYIFSTVLIIASLAVITSKHPVYAVLFLILAFFNAAGLFVLLGAEFLAMLLVIIYVGAVAVLFLFIVMMLNIQFSKMKEAFGRYLPIGLLVSILLFAELFTLLKYIVANRVESVKAPVLADPVTNTEAIGLVLYTDYMYLFQLSGLILLVAMIGAIVLTFRRREGVCSQDIQKQLSRKPKDSITLVNVKTGSGVK